MEQAKQQSMQQPTQQPTQQSTQQPNISCRIQPASEDKTASAAIQPQKNPYTSKDLAYPKKPDTVYTKKMKEHFSFFGVGSLLYAIFYTFCLYRNTSGITYPFFVVGTLFYFFFSMQKLGVPYKKNSIFYLFSIVLLGISNCLTNSAPLLFFNKCGIFLLAFILMLHTMYEDTDWNLPKYFAACFQMIGTAFSCLFRPFGDMVSYFDAQKQKKSGKKSALIPVMIGISIAVPLLFVVTLLLASADAVFADLSFYLIESINFVTVFGVSFTMIAAFFCSYTVYAALSMKNIKEETTDHRTLDPVTAIIVTSALCFVYLVFSAIQILYLFIGNMQLPEGYTYSSYAREGFFQLLAVCVLNLVIVMICLYFFRENKILKVILTILCGCTFIMILSSGLRMLMYINRYNLTLLRILVLWALAVILLLMAGVTVFIYRNSFPLFSYGITVVTLFYIGLSFAHPDYWIARYNLEQDHLTYLDDYDLRDSQNYLATLSADAAPVLLNEKYNFYLPDRKESIREEEIFSENYDRVTARLNPKETMTEEPDWVRLYFRKIDLLSKEMHIRNFNFSIHAAEKYLW